MYVTNVTGFRSFNWTTDPNSPIACYGNSQQQDIYVSVSTNQGTTGTTTASLTPYYGPPGGFNPGTVLCAVSGGNGYGRVNFFIVPPGGYYSVCMDGPGQISSWIEYTEGPNDGTQYEDPMSKRSPGIKDPLKSKRSSGIKKPPKGKKGSKVKKSRQFATCQKIALALYEDPSYAQTPKCRFLISSELKLYYLHNIGNQP